MTNPYTEFEKLVDKLNDIKPYLTKIVQKERYTTYMETAEETGVFTAHQSRVLGTLGLHEDELGNPPPPAVVVQSRDPPMVGEKYFNMIEAARNQTNNIPEKCQIERSSGSSTSKRPETTGSNNISKLKGGLNIRAPAVIIYQYTTSS
ncbi:hypothetical protein [Halostella salina]|uniref:hypothetical protein n=1 Tax=Halostella salina TaxID=1547897 RepID=UPI0013CF3891|nr:hypothetical protein [Halostella salina]